jgi:hypothetical protein
MFADFARAVERCRGQERIGGEQRLAPVFEVFAPGVPSPVWAIHVSEIYEDVCDVRSELRIRAEFTGQQLREWAAQRMRRLMAKLTAAS